MEFRIYSARCTGNAKNTLYPDEMVISDAVQMKNAIANDHVCARYQNSHRAIEDFITSDVISLDCDNDHTENPDEWITPEILMDTLSDVSMVFVFSRHHNKVKKNKPARPKFHVFFPVKEITDAKLYGDLKKQLWEMFPFFDNKALDAAHFYFGSDGDVQWREGSMNVVDFLFLNNTVTSNFYDYYGMSKSSFEKNGIDLSRHITIRKLKEHNVECFFEKENIWTFDSKDKASTKRMENHSKYSSCNYKQRNV